MSRFQKVLIASSFNWPVYADSFVSALQKFNIEVERFDFNNYFKSFIQKIQLRLGNGYSLYKMNYDLCKKAYLFNPERLRLWNGLGVFPGTIMRLKKKTWVSCYTNDDPFGVRGKHYFWRKFIKCLPIYNSHHVYRVINIKEYHDFGVKNVGLLKSYYVPWIHYPKHDIPKDNDVTFIGHYEVNRLEILRKIASAGINVNVYGPAKQWIKNIKSKDNITFIPGSLDPYQYSDIVRKSSVCLGFLSRVNRDDYTRRYFEIPACGGFIIGEKSEFLKSLFKENEEMIFYSTIDDLISKINFYLKNESERDKIVEAGLLRCKTSGYDVFSAAKGWILDTQKFRSVC